METCPEGLLAEQLKVAGGFENDDGALAVFRRFAGLRGSVDRDGPAGRGDGQGDTRDGARRQIDGGAVAVVDADCDFEKAAGRGFGALRPLEINQVGTDVDLAETAGAG